MMSILYRAHNCFIQYITVIIQYLEIYTILVDKYIWFVGLIIP